MGKEKRPCSGDHASTLGEIDKRIDELRAQMEASKQRFVLVVVKNWQPITLSLAPPLGLKSAYYLGRFIEPFLTTEGPNEKMEVHTREHSVIRFPTLNPTATRRKGTIQDWNAVGRNLLLPTHKETRGNHLLEIVVGAQRIKEWRISEQEAGRAYSVEAVQKLFQAFGVGCRG